MKLVFLSLFHIHVCLLFRLMPLKELAKVRPTALSLEVMRLLKLLCCWVVDERSLEVAMFSLSVTLLALFKHDTPLGRPKIEPLQTFWTANWYDVDLCKLDGIERLRQLLIANDDAVWEALLHVWLTTTCCGDAIGVWTWMVLLQPLLMVNWLEPLQDTLDGWLVRHRYRKFGWCRTVEAIVNNRLIWQRCLLSPRCTATCIVDSYWEWWCYCSLNLWGIIVAIVDGKLIRVLLMRLDGTGRDICVQLHHSMIPGCMCFQTLLFAERSEGKCLTVYLHWAGDSGLVEGSAIVHS